MLIDFIAELERRMPNSITYSDEWINAKHQVCISKTPVAGSTYWAKLSIHSIEHRIPFSGNDIRYAHDLYFAAVVGPDFSGFLGVHSATEIKARWEAYKLPELLLSMIPSEQGVLF